MYIHIWIKIMVTIVSRKGMEMVSVIFKIHPWVIIDVRISYRSDGHAWVWVRIIIKPDAVLEKKSIDSKFYYECFGRKFCLE